MTANNDHNAKDGQSTLHAAIYQRLAEAQRRETAPQVDDLVTLARQQGYSDVTVFEDTYTSGRRTHQQHTLLSQLMQQIADPTQPQNPIRAIFSSTEDRFFRDADGTTIASFIQVCQEHGVTVITPHFAYDFTQPPHVALFRLKCEEAYQFVTQMVVSRLQAGRQAARRKRGSQQSGEQAKDGN